MNKRSIVMIGPSPRSLGGISSVVGTYQRAGLFERWPIIYVSTFDGGNGLKKGIAALAGFARYLALVGTGRLAILHVQGASRWSFLRKSLFVLVAVACDRPVIFHLHGAEFINAYEHELGPLARRYVRFILDQCTGIIVLSERWKTMLQNITRNENIRIIMNPIDGTTRQSEKLPENAGNLLFLGELGERKGIYGLLDAIAALESRREWQLSIGGNGDIDGVRRRIRELEIEDRARVLGWVGGTQKSELLDKAAALILPSFAEGLPMSMLEAMAHGTAVITTPVGGVADLFEDGVDGILVPPGNIEMLTNAISHLLENPELAKQMGAQGRQKFETRFSSDVILPQLESLYSELGMHRKNSQARANCEMR